MLEIALGFTALFIGLVIGSITVILLMTVPIMLAIFLGSILIPIIITTTNNTFNKIFKWGNQKWRH